MRNLTASILLAIGLTGSAFADTTPATPTEQPTTAAVSSTASTQGTATTATPTTDSSANTGNEVKRRDLNRLSLRVKIHHLQRLKTQKILRQRQKICHHK